MAKALIGAAGALVFVIGRAWMLFCPSAPSEIASVARLPGSAAQQPPLSVETTALNGDRLIDLPMTDENVEPTKDEPSIDDSTSAEPAIAAADPSALPIDLTDHYRLKAANFDKITDHPWPAAPRGSQTFANVPLEIGGAILLWGENNSNRGMNFLEQVAGVLLNQRFETLYVCQGCFFEGPSSTPVCEVVFHYDDGTSAADTIVCGVDSRDWYANQAQFPVGPTGPRSTLAWTGKGKAGDRTEAIRFCLTAIANPHPKKEVTAVDFVSSKSQTTACILAVTAGKSGLMRPTEESLRINLLMSKAAGDAVTARGQIDMALRTKAAIVGRICGLTDAQKEKLQLAGRGDKQRLIDRVEEIRTQLQLVKNDPDKVKKLVTEDEPTMRGIITPGLPTDGSLFVKSLERLLTAEQAFKYAPLRPVVRAGGLVQTQQLASDDVVEFNLSGTAFEDDDLAHLSEWPASPVLYSLNLTGTKVTDAGLQHLKTLSHLRNLDLSRIQISDAGLAHLKGLTTLKHLTLAGLNERLSDAATADLKRALPMLEIHW